MSDYLLDTGVLVRCLRGFPDTLALARDLTEEGDLHISVWSQMELLTLAHPAEEKRTLDFIAPFILHPITEPIAQRAAGLVGGSPTERAALSVAQALIAATALQHGLTLVTYDPELRQVGDLKLYPLPTAA